jgi:hypothetical protein
MKSARMSTKEITRGSKIMFNFAIHGEFVEKTSPMRGFRRYIFANMGSEFGDTSLFETTQHAVLVAVMQRLERSGMTGIYIIINTLVVPQHPILHSTQLHREVLAFSKAIKPLTELGEKAAYASFNLTYPQMQDLRVSQFAHLLNAAVVIARLQVKKMGDYIISPNIRSEETQKFASDYHKEMVRFCSAGESSFITANDNLSIRLHEAVYLKLLSRKRPEEVPMGLIDAVVPSAGAPTGVSYNTLLGRTPPPSSSEDVSGLP